MSLFGDRRIWGVAAGALTLLWLALAGAYVLDYWGVDGLLGLLPHELGGVLAGVFTPIFCIWLIAIYLMRGREIRDYNDKLAARLAELTFPDAAGEHRLQSVSEALKRQAAELRLATEEAAAALDGTRALFRSQASDLDTAAKAARSRTEDVEATLAEQR